MSEEQQVPGTSGSGAQNGPVAGRPEDTTLAFGSIGPVDGEPVALGLTAEQSAAVQALPRTSALLVMQRGGPGSGARFLLDADRTVAGRSTDADIFLDDVTVSRKHAEFVRELDDFVVRDIGSLNGTYVNRERIDAVVLRPGDEVQIGKFRMTFHPSPAAHRGSTDS